jgi:hypothetical protein
MPRPISFNCDSTDSRLPERSIEAYLMAEQESELIDLILWPPIINHPHQFNTLYICFYY